MEKLRRFFYYLSSNSFVQSAFFLLAVGILAALRWYEHYSEIVHWSLAIAFCLLCVGVMQVIVMLFDKKLMEYHDLAVLIERLRNVEHELEARGGIGRGMYEKAESIEAKLPKGLLKEVFHLAEIRNKAMHGNVQIPNAADVHKKARRLYIRVRFSNFGFNVLHWLTLLVFWIATALFAYLLYLHFFAKAEEFTLGVFLVMVGGIYFVNRLLHSMMGDVGYLLILLILGGVFYKTLYEIVTKVAAYVF